MHEFELIKNYFQKLSTKPHEKVKSNYLIYFEKDVITKRQSQKSK